MATEAHAATLTFMRACRWKWGLLLSMTVGCTVESLRAVEVGTGGPSEEGVADSSGEVEPEASTGAGADESSSGGAGDEGPVLCTDDASSFIYLLGGGGDGNDPGSATLHRLEPATLEVIELGELDCGAAPVSMTLAQDGTLWSIMINDVDGLPVLMHLNPDSLACEQVNDAWPSGFQPLGLAFARNADGTDTLFVGGFDPAAFSGEGGDPFAFPHQLVRVDLDPVAVSRVGATALVPNEWYQGADLVGTGDGRLLGLFANVAHVVEIDPWGPTLTSMQAVGVGLGSPWALTQWEGQAWLFAGGDDGSSIQAFDLETGALSSVSEGIGVSVVGAAASTCAPFTPEG